MDLGLHHLHSLVSSCARNRCAFNFFFMNGLLKVDNGASHSTNQCRIFITGCAPTKGSVSVGSKPYTNGTGKEPAGREAMVSGLRDQRCRTAKSAYDQPVKRKTLSEEISQRFKKYLEKAFVFVVFCVLDVV